MEADHVSGRVAHLGMGQVCLTASGSEQKDKIRYPQSRLCI